MISTRSRNKLIFLILAYFITTVLPSCFLNEKKLSTNGSLLNTIKSKDGIVFIDSAFLYKVDIISKSEDYYCGILSPNRLSLNSVIRRYKNFDYYIIDTVTVESMLSLNYYYSIKIDNTVTIESNLYNEQFLEEITRSNFYCKEYLISGWFQYHTISGGSYNSLSTILADIRDGREVIVYWRYFKE